VIRPKGEAGSAFGVPGDIALALPASVAMLAIE